MERESGFSRAQAAYIKALKSGAYRPFAPSGRGPAEFSLEDAMPPVLDSQALRGTCVVNAVVAMLEYFGDCKTRLSVQFLYAATKELERAGLERNLALVAAGEKPDAPFEAVFHRALLQLKMLAEANGGFDSPAVRPYVMKFEEGVRERFDVQGGNLLRTCFKAVETKGVCRHRLWPYAPAMATPLFGQHGEILYPPGTREDAAKRRMHHGLYILDSPNNVDEIRGILSGANGRRPMPVCVTVETFEGCDGETYSFPRLRDGADGEPEPVDAWTGRHGLLVVGYRNDPSFDGGGFFTVRNSYGREWGRGGYGRLPYAYLECFAIEAGTILQDAIDYEGDGYGGMFAEKGGGTAESGSSGTRRFLLELLTGLLLIGIAFALAKIF